ncbi:MAG TPA: nucleotide exchange factor GrpE, partial [Chthoniobacterales bacterium]
MPEPKREEEKILSYDTGREEKNERPAFFAGDEATSVDAPSPADEALAAEVQKLRAEKDELLQTMVRRQADFENFRKRTERERGEESRRGTERLVLDVIPVLDAFDRALQGHEDPAYDEYRKGVT